MKKRIMFAIIAIALMMEVLLVNVAQAKEIKLNFRGVLSFSVNSEGKLAEASDEFVSFYPADGGWFAAEVLLSPALLPTMIDGNNVDSVLQLCIDKMTGFYSGAEVLRKDIIWFGDIPVFHVQDVSFNESNHYLVFSEGFLIGTRKGIIALWFANFPGNLINDSFIESLLESLVVENDSHSLFTIGEVKELLDRKKLHYEFVESEESFKYFTTPFGNPVKGKPTQNVIDQYSTKVFMNDKERRTGFAVLALSEAFLVDTRLIFAYEKPIAFFTGRNNNSTISAFVFDQSKMISIEYNEKTKEIIVTTNGYSESPESVMESLKRRGTLVSYYENDLIKSAEYLSEIDKKLLGEVKNEAQNNSGNQDVSAGETISGDNDVTPLFKEMMDSYEAFFDEYIDFMERYQKESNPLSMMTDYYEIMMRYSEFAEKIDAIDESALPLADQKYYLEVVTRVNKKLLDFNEE